MNVDLHFVQPCQLGIGRQPRIEHEMARKFAVGSFPEGDEPKDLFRLLALAEVGVGITEGPAVGILRQKDENAGLATAAGGDIVALAPTGCSP